MSQHFQDLSVHVSICKIETFSSRISTSKISKRRIFAEVLKKKSFSKKSN
jgi:hypothetical protein